MENKFQRFLKIKSAYKQFLNNKLMNKPFEVKKTTRDSPFVPAKVQISPLCILIIPIVVLIINIKANNIFDINQSENNYSFIKEHVSGLEETVKKVALEHNWQVVWNTNENSSSPEKILTNSDGDDKFINWASKVLTQGIPGVRIKFYKGNNVLVVD